MKKTLIQIALLASLFYSCNSPLSSETDKNLDISKDQKSTANVDPNGVSDNLTKKQKDSILLNKLNSIIDKKLFDRGRIKTENSYPSGVSEARYQANEQESKLIITFKSNFTCDIIFQPILKNEIVKKSVGWSFKDDNHIELSKDVFAIVPVTNAAFPSSEEQFYDYILVKKNIEIIGNELLIDIRDTNRENFFVQYLVAEQSGETNNKADYALKLLNELSFDYQIVWRYFYYYGIQ